MCAETKTDIVSNIWWQPKRMPESTENVMPKVRMWRQGDRYKFSGVNQGLVDRVCEIYLQTQRIRIEIMTWDAENGYPNDVFTEWVEILEKMVSFTGKLKPPVRPPV